MLIQTWQEKGGGGKQRADAKDLSKETRARKKEDMFKGTGKGRRACYILAMLEILNVFFYTLKQP